MRQRKLIIGLLVMLALVVSSFTYAYWASTINQSADVPGTVTIGEGGTTTVTASFGGASASDLVPSAYDGDDTAVLTFPVSWAEDVLDTAGGSGTLTVAIESYSLGSLTEAQIDAMFSITITQGQGSVITIDGAAVNVQVTVVFHTEPATKALYDIVANGTLSVTLSFTVNPS